MAVERRCGAGRHRGGSRVAPPSLPIPPTPHAIVARRRASSCSRTPCRGRGGCAVTPSWLRRPGSSGSGRRRPLPRRRRRPRAWSSRSGHRRLRTRATGSSAAGAAPALAPPAGRQPGQDVAVLIEREASIEPCRIRFGADEHEDLTDRKARRRAGVAVANRRALQAPPRSP